MLLHSPFLAFLLSLYFTPFILASSKTSKVKELGTSNFDTELAASTQDLLVEFYAPWCKLCQEFSSTYEQIATDLDGIVRVARVDVTSPKNRDMGIRFDVTGFPIFKLLHEGRTFSYQGPRTHEDLKSFATGGYKLYESAPTPAHPGFLGLLQRVYMHAYKAGIEDYKEGHYISLNIFVAVVPGLIVLIIFIGCILPEPKWEPPKRKNPAESTDDSDKLE